MLAGGLAGCAHQAEIGMTSSRLNAYHADIKRLLVVTDFGQTFKYRAGDPESVFESTFMDALSKCSIAVQFHKHNPLALENEEALAVKSFAPDTILELRWRSSVTNNLGIPVSSVLMGTIIEWSTKRQVWKAEIDFVPAFNAGETLSETIIGRLRQETILDPSCPVPIIPQV